MQWLNLAQNLMRCLVIISIAKHFYERMLVENKRLDKNEQAALENRRVLYYVMSEVGFLIITQNFGIMILATNLMLKF